MKGTSNIPVVDIILRRENKVLFVLRQNTGWRDGFYALPGGHVEGSESFKQAACRELLEEVGITVNPEQLEHRITFQTINELGEIRAGIYFEAMNWTGEPINAEPDVHAEITWLDIDNLPENATPNVKLKFKAIAAGQKYIEYGWEGK